jgi:hypothetical protein
MADRNKKGRARGGSLPGSLHPGATLTENDIHCIRVMCSRGVAQSIIADLFSVSQSHVSNINTNKAWSHK